ncbi:tRNA lysidine(34) synthetase TilS [Microcoleus sp. FACHB-672]|uniref:tRNA lysidine(34) synthetase TilS n=1 Tax=Microcoleus sp. FACHB-672 TaxID=2692825 RepID=UPI0016885875|nr:tRNA lysidine(34) synthetase TilS [Microcoleus sp. FACHB-672]MBD2041552.1 tRNA lysidine(34) synthetase TilS [Microcoleus sp. FACHB-672]
MPNWTPLHAQIHRLLRHRQLLPPNQRLLIAVSGGQDSLCLAQLLLDLQPKWGWQLGIAHCDHRWRPDSEANADYVQQLAATWQLPFHRQVAEEIPKSEAAARHWRYQVLSIIAIQNQYQYILTGHTASDRAETLLYNLIRGAGADGLQALTWKRPLDAGVQLVRPLLEVTRIQTGLFCQEAGLEIWEDSTNQDRHYARNRIRNELLPYLQTHFNPKVEQALAQTAELLRSDVEYLEEVAGKVLQESISQTYQEVYIKIALNRHILRSHPLAIQRRVMRRLLEQVLAGAPSFEHIEKLTNLISAPSRTRTDPFPGGAFAEVAGDLICVFEKPI